MKKTIETSKGRFVVLNESDLDFKEKKGITYVYNNKRLIDWHNRIKLSEITEEQASNIVDETIMYKKHKVKCYRFRSYTVGFIAFDNSIESLHSLLKHHNIEITPNTYIFKL